MLYPLLIWVGTVYQGEHYVIDVILGIIYAVIGYLVAPYIMKLLRRFWIRGKTFIEDKIKTSGRSTPQ